MKRYLLVFPTVTKIKNKKKFTLKMPAIKVSGSPITGIHANNKDQTPNLLNLLEAFMITFFLKGNHFLLMQLNK
jgi:hypothetical protein